MRDEVQGLPKLSLECRTRNMNLYHEHEAIKRQTRFLKTKLKILVYNIPQILKKKAVF
jgi:hypothetical protein